MLKDARLATSVLISLVAGCMHTSVPDQVLKSDEEGPSVAEGPAVVAEENPRIAESGGETPPPPASNTVERGIAWLLAHQLPSGGWGQGDESPNMGNNAEVRDVANVADTCMATLALVRSGSTPRRGPYQQQVTRAVELVLASIEQSDADSMWVTEVRSTRVQAKIGQYVDTFASLNLLNELRNEMPTPQAEARMRAALAKVIRKIERNQANDGTWAQSGWAPTLGQSLAARGLNRAAQGGTTVAAPVLRRVETNALQGVDVQAGRLRRRAAGSAGVDLYDAAEAASTLRESATTAAHKGDKQEAPASQAAARAEAAEAGLMERLREPSFVSGFGSNGGEEFLSYMLISDTLRVRGGERWNEWRTRIGGLMEGVQNGDGSWSGHHCITGRTFCTAMALLVLMAERAPTPAQGQG